QVKKSFFFNMTIRLTIGGMLPMMEDLLVFTTVVEQSSLNKASKLLNLSQPALSRKIAKLEEEWGVALFERKGKRLELTRVGQEAYIYAMEQRQRHQHLDRKSVV